MTVEYLKRAGQWRAWSQVDGVMYNLGLWNTKEEGEAAFARSKAGDLSDAIIGKMEITMPKPPFDIPDAPKAVTQASKVPVVGVEDEKKPVERHTFDFGYHDEDF